MEPKTHRHQLYRLAATVTLLIPFVAIAHPMHTLNAKFANSLAHGFSGWEHFLALLSLGYWMGWSFSHFRSPQGIAALCLTTAYAMTHPDLAPAALSVSLGLFMGFFLVAGLGITVQHLVSRQPSLTMLRIGGALTPLPVLALACS
ncbi:MAG: hypothetical protein M2R45_03788 [Verrucomicrobia subdivision 3 bacterium]|nr:hypothetical protein [Limisphaerales bacterium]MCS1416771.1 hypothetical protein [Limisphaerales bacterium]